MALATQCPHCGTQFRVAADQLKLRGGIVRCGACQQIFDGNSALVDLAAGPAPVVAAPADAPADVDVPVFSPAPVDETPVETPVETLAPVSEPVAPQEPEPAPTPASTPEPDTLTAPEPSREHTADSIGPPTLLLRESSGGSPPIASSVPASPRNRAAEARARRVKAAPPHIDEAPKPPPPPPKPKPDIDEPEFVRSTRQREASSKTTRIALAVGSVLLLIALVVQAAASFRDVLAARHPGLRPALVSTCALFGCSVNLPARPEQLVIETGELITLGGNAYTFSTVLRNQGDMALAWPSLELTLNDLDDKPLVRRVFAPRDYAGAAAAAPTGFAARGEQQVRIHFRLEGAEPSGYHIAVFYP
ncbi:zinc-ribbon domain-containing protein [Oxalobacteraceae sp. CFBP 13730]|nr:zinc-ribbon domain-containing protein [Oxalobacteraceae sp. CFBP 13730]